MAEFWENDPVSDPRDGPLEPPQGGVAIADAPWNDDWGVPVEDFSEKVNSQAVEGIFNDLFADAKRRGAVSLSPGQEPKGPPPGERWEKKRQWQLENLKKFVEDARDESVSEDSLPWLAKRMPSALPVAVSILEERAIKKIVQRVDDNRATLDDLKGLAHHVVRLEQKENASIGEDIIDAASYLPSFAIDFLSGKGIYKGVRSLVFKGATKGGAVNLAKRTVSRAVAVGAMTAGGMPHRVIGSAHDRLKHQFALSDDDAGRVKVLIQRNDKEFLNELPKGFLDMFIENTGEMSGLYIAKAITKIPGVKAAMGAMAKMPMPQRIRGMKEWFIWRALKSGKSVADLEKFGYHGIIPEILEERAGEPARYLTGVTEDAGASGQLVSLDADETLKGFRQIFVEVNSFMLLPLAAKLASHGNKKREKESYDELITSIEGTDLIPDPAPPLREPPPQPLQGEVTEQQEPLRLQGETPEQRPDNRPIDVPLVGGPIVELNTASAERLALEAPELAKEVAESEPTRKTFLALGMPAKSMPPRAAREKFQSLLGQHLEQQAEQQIAVDLMGREESQGEEEEVTSQEAADIRAGNLPGLPAGQLRSSKPTRSERIADLRSQVERLYTPALQADDLGHEGIENDVVELDAPLTKKQRREIKRANPGVVFTEDGKRIKEIEEVRYQAQLPRKKAPKGEPVAPESAPTKEPAVDSPLGAFVKNRGATEAKSKQPWEMTKEEFGDTFFVRGVERDRKNKVASDPSGGLASPAREVTGNAIDEAGEPISNQSAWRQSPPALYGEGGQVHLFRRDQVTGDESGGWVRVKPGAQPSYTFEESTVNAEGDPHKAAVAQALREGKSVPAEVLREYPEFLSGRASAQVGTGQHRRFSKVQLRRKLGKTFPGVKMSEDATTEAGFTLHFPQGDVQVRQRPRIVFSEEAWEKAGRARGRKFSKKDREAAEAMGSFELTDASGSFSGVALMQFAEQMEEGTVPHEAIHLARAMGFFSPSQWDRLVKKHAPNAETVEAQEEQVAEAIGSQSIFQRLKNWFKRLLAKFGLRRLSDKDVEAMLGTPEFWQQQRESPSQLDEQLQNPQEQVAALSLSNPKYVHANPGTTQGTRNVTDRIDKDRREQGKPNRVHDMDVAREAERLLEEDPEGWREQLVAMAKNGALINDVETIIGHRLFNQMTEEGLVTGNLDLLSDARVLIEAIRDSKADVARSLRSGRDPLESPTQRMQRVLGEGLLSLPTDLEKRRRRAKKNGDQGELDRINDEWKKRYDALLKRLKKMGIDPTNIPDLARNEEAAQKALVQIEAANHGVSDRAWEYWSQAILSGPQTHMRNFIGNTGHAAWHFALEKPMEALANLAVRDPNSASFGELKYVWKGLLPGISLGLKMAAKSWRTETAALQILLNREQTSKFEGRSHAIPGWMGRFVRMFGWRALLAADEFGKSISTRMEVGARAYRISKEQGLEGDMLQAGIEFQMEDLESDAWHQALDVAVELAFQQEGTAAGKAVKDVGKSVRRKVWGIRYIIPFIETPTNIVETGILKSPFGIFYLGYLWNEARKTGDYSKVTPRMAQQLIAWSLLLIMMGLWDDDEPLITGAESEGSAKDREMARRTHPSQSINIGGTWVSYKGVEPIATSVAGTVDATNTLKRGDFGGALNGMIGQLREKSMLQGISDVFRVMDSEDSAEAIKRWSANFAVSWIPNIIRQPARARQSEYAERRVWGDGKHVNNMILKRMAQKAEVPQYFGLVEDQPSVDLWGRTTSRQHLDQPETNFIYRAWNKTLMAIAPYQVKDEDIFIGDRFLMRYNELHPDDETLPRAPTGKSYKGADGKKVSMSDAQYAQFLQHSGTLARLLVSMNPLDVENPTTTQKKWITDDISEARRVSKEMLAMEWNHGIEATTDLEALAEQVNSGQIKRMRTRANSPMPSRRPGEPVNEYKLRKQTWKQQKDRARQFFTLRRAMLTPTTP